MGQVMVSLLVVPLLLLTGPIGSVSVGAAESPMPEKGTRTTKAPPPGETSGESVSVGPLRVSDALPAPPGFIQASKCVAHEGIHYVREGTSSLPPILAYDESGKLVSIEYIIPQRQSKGEVSWKGLPGVAGRPVDHVNIEYFPMSPRAGGVPHYTVHLYFVPVEAHQAICPESTASEPAGRTMRHQ
jgi:hypothetical protein